MTLNIEGLVKQLGKKYQDIKDKGLIPYKVKPGDGDEDTLFINLTQYDGVFLSFDNNKEQKLNEIELTLEDKNKTDWIFPNIMPFELEPVMTQEWVHARFGTPLVYGKPKPNGFIIRGVLEIYPLLPPNQDIAVQFVYNFDSFVKRVIFYSIEHAKEIQERVEKLRMEGGDY